jgi:hypothetical protein
MTSIGLDQLSDVCGAATRSQTAYAQCSERVIANERNRLPSTRPWWNPLATDGNEPARAKATLDRVRTECGLPPA